MSVTPDPIPHVRFASVVLDGWKASVDHARKTSGVRDFSTSQPIIRAIRCASITLTASGTDSTLGRNKMASRMSGGKLVSHVMCVMRAVVSWA